MVQVEYAGICVNTQPSLNTKDPYFAELHVFPVASDSSVADLNKVFISIIMVEGKTQVAEPTQDFDTDQTCSTTQGLPSRMSRLYSTASQNDTNVYKRVAEYCLDISQLRED